MRVLSGARVPLSSSPVRATSVRVPRSARASQNRVAARAEGDKSGSGQSDPPGKGGREWLQSILSKFGPINDTPGTGAVLDFEKPLVELDNRIREVRTLFRIV